MRFDVGQGLDHFIAQLVDALGEFAGELLVGGAQGQFRARMDQVGHRFGLGQVDAAVQKGAPGEFARFGQARAAFEHGVQHQFCRQDAAMAGDFHHVLARERARRAHDGDQHLVHCDTMADNSAVVNRVR